MAKLKTDYQDDILSDSMDGKHRYNLTENEDGSTSVEDATEYDQRGDDFGAAEINETNATVNSMMYVEVTVPADKWAARNTVVSGNDYTTVYYAMIAVDGMTSDWTPGAPALVPSGSSGSWLMTAYVYADIAAQEALSFISLIESSDGYLTFVCYENLPEVDLTMRIPGMVALEEG